MFRKSRFIFFAFIVYLVIFILPNHTAFQIRSKSSGFVAGILSFGDVFVDHFRDLASYKSNAQKLRQIEKASTESKADVAYFQEIEIENKRLKKILDLKDQSVFGSEDVLVARVIGKSLTPANKVLFIDKGTEQGLKPNRLVMYGSSLVGKIMEAYPDSSSVLLLNDPNSRMGVMVQRTRQSGVLVGTISGECRVKYLTLDEKVNAADVIQTAGFGNHFPKGVPIGKVVEVWREPGQIYQVAKVMPHVDFSQLEEVLCLKSYEASE